MNEIREVREIGGGLTECFIYLKAFIKNPLQEISKLPDWQWKQILTVQILLSVLSGTFAGLLSMSVFKILQGALLFPIVSTSIGLVLSAFFYYFFQVFERKTVPFQKLSNLVFIAYAPFFIFYIPSEFFSVSTIFGMAFTGMLLSVGLSANFALEKKRSVRLVGMLFALIFLLWMAEKISNMRMERSAEQQIENL